MIKFVSDVLGAEIVLFQEHAKLGPVKSIIFSPDDGRVLALECFNPIEKAPRVILTDEINRMAENTIVVRGYDSLVDAAEVVRLDVPIKTGARIIAEKVMTESGQHLGKVGNATLNTQGWRLVKLYVETSFGLNLFAKELLIPVEKIIKIEKKQIIVSDSYAKSKARAVLPATNDLPA